MGKAEWEVVGIFAIIGIILVVMRVCPIVLYIVGGFFCILQFAAMIVVFLIWKKGD